MGSPITDVLRAWRDALSVLDSRPLAPRVEELEALARQLGSMYRQLDATLQPYPAELLTEAHELIERTRSFLAPAWRPPVHQEAGLQ
jgi:hypothetical protein